ncbi:MAG: hypothetical protein VXZ70_07180 [Pseudomonadota bacterium]|nr:hypothetical protein [Pseudomonadota bacterium]
MKVVVKNDGYTIYQRRDGRYAVEGADKNPINGNEKVAILAANELIAVTRPAAPEEEAASPEAEAAETETQAAEAGDPEPAAAEASGKQAEEPADASDDDAKAVDEE